MIIKLGRSVTLLLLLFSVGSFAKPKENIMADPWGLDPDPTLLTGEAAPEVGSPSNIERSSEPTNGEKNPSEVPEQSGKTGTGSASRSSGDDDGKTVVPTPTEKRYGGLTRAEIARCEQQYSTYMKSCNDVVQTTDYSCEAQNSVEMTSASQRASHSSIKIQNRSVESVLASCSEMAQVSDQAAGAVTAYRAKCSSSIVQCRTQCSEFVNFVNTNPGCFTGEAAEVSPITSLTLGEASSTAAASAGRCQSFQPKVVDATTAIQNYEETEDRSRRCSGEVAGGDSDNVEGKHNKPVGLGAVACNDPSCGSDGRNIAEAAAVRGTQIASDSLAEREMSGNASRGQKGVATIGSANAQSDSISVTAKVDMETKGSLAHRSVSSVGLGLASVEGPAGQVTDFASASGSHSSVQGSDEGSNSKPASASLRSYLPGGHNANGMHGASGPDGITGPHSDIWRKIQNRYRANFGTFLP